MRSKKGKVAVVGLGYVGLPLALLAKKNGYEVVGIDRDKSVVDEINLKRCPFRDEKVNRDLNRIGLRATVRMDETGTAQIVIVCVPTPVTARHKPDLEPVKSSFNSIGNYLQKNQLIILESTVNPGVMKEIVIPILEKKSGLIAGKDFYVAYCPERIDPGNKFWNVENLPRVVGSLEKVGLKKAVEFYSSVLKSIVKPMQSIEEAEAVKMFENCFRDVNIALVNEFARSFDKLGIDILHVIDGASGKPYSFLPHYPGCGVGGHCIPVDPYYMIAYAENKGFDHKLLKLVRTINNDMPKYAVSQVIYGLKHNNKNIKNAKVALLGLAYKKNISDTRESPSFKILKLLKKAGMKVNIYDPFLISRSTHNSLDKVLTKVDAVIIATDHDVFAKIKPSLLRNKGISVIVDGRNCLDKESFIKAGIFYKGIGR